MPDEKREKLYFILGIFFVVGLLLIAGSYMGGPDLRCADFCRAVLRNLGIAVALAASFGWIVDTFFHRVLLDKVEDAYQRITANLTEQMKAVLERMDAVLEQVRAVPAMSGCLTSKIQNIYTDRTEAEKDMIEHLENARERVWLLGISLRTFFQGGGELNLRVKRIFRDNPPEAGGEPEREENASVASATDESASTDPKWQVLVLDPDCPQARIRSEREEPEDTPYDEATLPNEVRQTIRIVGHMKRDAKTTIDLRKYDGAPSCAVYLIDDVIFVEQYHYGREGGDRVSELVPLIKYGRESSTYKQLEGHFKYMWGTLSTSPYDKDADEKSAKQTQRSVGRSSGKASRK